MSRVSSKLAKRTKKQELIKELQITEKDIEFILLAIKQSMIPGSSLEQAVSTIEKLQEIYKKLTSDTVLSDAQPEMGAIRRAQAQQQKEAEKAEDIEE